MIKAVLRNYVIATAICLILAGLGLVPYLFFGQKDAAVYQIVYYLFVLGIGLVMTIALGIERISYKTFNKFGLSYCLVSIINVVLPVSGLYYISQAGFSLWLLLLLSVLVVGILINRDILKQL